MGKAKEKIENAALKVAPAVTRALVTTQTQIANHAMDHPSMLRRVVFVLVPTADGRIYKKLKICRTILNDDAVQSFDMLI